MITSTLKRKSQTTVPEAVRSALELQEGDRIVYTIENGRVVITRSRPVSEDPFALFTEWDSEADRRAYADL